MRLEKKPPEINVHFYRSAGRGHKATYEIWVTRPEKIMTVNKVNSGLFITEDEKEFANLREVAIHALEKNNLTDAIEGMLQVKGSKEKVYKIDGMEIVKAGKWIEFCGLKNINEDNKNAVVKSHWLKESELKELGLDPKKVA